GRQGARGVPPPRPDRRPAGQRGSPGVPRRLLRRRQGVAPGHARRGGFPLGPAYEQGTAAPAEAPRQRGGLPQPAGRPDAPDDRGRRPDPPLGRPDPPGAGAGPGPPRPEPPRGLPRPPP